VSAAATHVKQLLCSELSATLKQGSSSEAAQIKSGCSPRPGSRLLGIWHAALTRGTARTPLGAPGWCLSTPCSSAWRWCLRWSSAQSGARRGEAVRARTTSHPAAALGWAGTMRGEHSLSVPTHHLITHIDEAAGAGALLARGCAEQAAVARRELGLVAAVAQAALALRARTRSSAVSSTVSPAVQQCSAS
jgi:hypothetical protein